MKTQMCDHLGPRRQKASSLPSKPFPSDTNVTASRTVAWLRDAHHAAMGGRGDDRERGGGANWSGVGGARTEDLQVPAWYLRALTLCLWAGNVRTLSPVSASQHLTVRSALPEYRSRSVSWRKSMRVSHWP